MPKIVDRADQRRQIAAALLDVVRDGGFEQVSVRTVAAAAGRSAGAVQKYFASRDEMLDAAMDLVNERIEQRWESLDLSSGTLRGFVRDLVLATLPLDAERRADAVVQFAFTTAAAHRPRFAADLAELDGRLIEPLSGFLAEVGVAEPAAVARAVLAVSDGIALTLLTRPDGTDECLAALDAFLAAMVPDEPFSYQPKNSA